MNYSVDFMNYSVRIVQNELAFQNIVQQVNKIKTDLRS